MQTRQIPKGDWPSFLKSFSSRHQGWLMNLEVFGPDIGAQVEGRWLVFEGLTDDKVPGDRIIITAGDKPDEHLTHTIIRPTEICLDKTAAGEDATLSITGDDGNKTLLTFPTPDIWERPIK